MGPLFVAVCELILVASLAVDHGLQVHGLQSQAQWSWCMGFSCSLACGIFSDQGSYPWPLHWQADSYLLYHQRIWVWDLASPFLQLIFKWDEYFCLFKRDGWGRTAFLTSTLGFSVWLFSESELPGIFFSLLPGSYLDLPLLHHYCSCPTYWGLCSQQLLLSTGLCQGQCVWCVTISNSQAPASGWIQHPQSSCSPAGTFPTLRPAKRPPISVAVLGIVYHAFQGVSDSNLVGLSLFLLSWLLCFIGKFREIKKLKCHHYLILRMAFSLSTTNWHLPSTSTRIKSCAAAATDLQYPWKEFKVESRNEALCAWEKIGRTGLQIHIFRRSWFWVQFLYFLISRKALKLFMVMTVFQD